MIAFPVPSLWAELRVGDDGGELLERWVEVRYEG